MPPRLKPGLAFWIVTDAGFAVGLMTHHRPTFGHLVWISEDTFDDPPTTGDVLGIKRWRWPVFFPLGTALHRKTVTKIADVEIPAELQPWPLMRGGNRQAGWKMLSLEGPEPMLAAGTPDPSVPPYILVNDIKLRELIVSGWRPANMW